MITSPPLNPALKMSYAEKLKRAAQKRKVLLDFLAGGEVYTTVSMVADLLQISVQTAQPLLKKLVAEKVLKLDAKAVPLSNLKLYGITYHGLALTESAHPQCPEFRVGKTNPSFLEHHLQGQRVRIVMQRAGWANWMPGKLLMVENSKRLKKLPDALATMPNGKRVAIEIERFIKSKNRMYVIIGEHLRQIQSGHYSAVYYFTPHLDSLNRVFRSIETFEHEGIYTKISANQRSYFHFVDIDNLKIDGGRANLIVDLTL